jgi:hypothetical protein
MSLAARRPMTQAPPIDPSQREARRAQPPTNAGATALRPSGHRQGVPRWRRCPQAERPSARCPTMPPPQALARPPSSHHIDCCAARRGREPPPPNERTTTKSFKYGRGGKEAAEESPTVALLASRPGCAGDWLSRRHGDGHDRGAGEGVALRFAPPDPPQRATRAERFKIHMHALSLKENCEKVRTK